MAFSTSLEAVHKAIDKALDKESALQKKILQSSGLTLQRAPDTDDEWKSMMKCGGYEDISSYQESKTPWHFGIRILDNNHNEEEVCGFLSFYVAYSTWNGKILYLDRLACPAANDSTKQLLLRTLAKVAVNLNYARLTWRVRHYCGESEMTQM